MFLLKKQLSKIWRQVILGKREADESGKINNPWIARAKFVAFIVVVILIVRAALLYKAEKQAKKEAEAERIAAEEAALAAKEYNGLPVPEDNEEAWNLVYNAEYFAIANPDIKEYYGDNPSEWFYHFTTYGLQEARRGSENFDPVYYRENNKDLSEAYGDDWKCYYLHYISFGYAEGRKGAE